MKMVSMGFKMALVVAGATGVLLHLFSADSVIESLSYYTMQSNILTVGFFGYLIYLMLSKKEVNNRKIQFLKGMVTVSIMMTMLVYHIVLRPILLTMETGYEVGSIKDLFVHYITPGFVLVDWLVFESKHRYRRWDPLLWLGIPVYYLVYVWVYGWMGGRFKLDEEVYRYPYFFMDVGTYGVWNVVLMSSMVLLLFVILGYAMIAFNHVLQPFKNKFYVASDE